MPRTVRTARGEEVDFDTIIIKQALAQAPMNVEVARRKDFIDTKEQTRRAPPVGVTTDGPIDQATFVAPENFDAVEPIKKTKKVEPVPNLPEKTS